MKSHSTVLLGSTTSYRYQEEKKSGRKFLKLNPHRMLGSDYLEDPIFSRQPKPPLIFLAYMGECIEERMYY